MESFINRERYPSGQRGQTVNLLAHAFGGSNPPLSRERHDTAKVFFCGSNSVARVTAFQAVGRGFKSRLPLMQCFIERDLGERSSMMADLAQVAQLVRAHPW